jgi:hypothetical protein
MRIGPTPLLAALLLLLAACTAEVREADLLRPVRGGALSATELAKAAPAYSLTEERIAAQGATLYAVHLRQPGATSTILYFGGNGFTIGRFGAWSASIFAPLARKLGPDGRIVLHGQSLGSFIAGDVAAARPAAGVVLESSATTAEEWTRVATPGLAKAFVKVKLDERLKGKGNLGAMSRIDEPLMLLVGAKDGTTPPIMSRGLYAASPLPPGRKTLVEVAGANHVDVMTKPQAIAAYRAFLARLR